MIRERAGFGGAEARPIAFPFAARRDRAVGIRLIQELRKRLDVRSAPRYSGLDSVRDLLSREALADLDAETPAGANPLTTFFARRAAALFPSRHLAARDPASLPDRAMLLADAERACHGEWEVFGHRVAVDVEEPNWRSHPISARQTAADRWHRVRYLHGETGGDVKFIWELNRHEQLLRMAQAYHLTGDERFAETFTRSLASWMRQNPPGVGVNWVSSLEVAFRGVAWCWCWHLTKSSRMWTDDLFGEFLWHLWQHARHVERFDSIHHSPNTHLTGEAIGLLYVGATFPELRGSARRRTRAIETLRSEIGHQILADGVHFERSTGYHRYTIEFYLHACLIANDIAPEAGRIFESALARLCDAARALRRPDGTWPVLGDEDGGRLLRLGTGSHVDQDSLLVAAAGLLGRPDWLPPRRSAGESVGDAWWLLDDKRWNALDRAQRVEPRAARSSVALAQAGYYVARDDDDAGWYCLVDAGPHGGILTGHAHSDLGHVEIACGDRHVVCDPGSPSYTSDANQRDWFRSEQAHACVCVDGAPMAVPNGPFGWRQVCGSPEVTTFDDGVVWTLDATFRRAAHDSSVEHRRQVALVRGVGVVVCDWVTAQSQGDIELRWPIPLGHEHVRLERFSSGATVWLAEDNITIECCWPTGTRAPNVALESALRSPTYGRTAAASTLSLRLPASAPVAIATCVGAAMSAVRPRFLGNRCAVIALDSEQDLRELVFQPDAPPVIRRAAAVSANVLEGTR